jgi:hypothetical protein
MILLWDGLTGSGKTYHMTKLLYREWLRGATLWVNFPLTFSKSNERIFRFHQLDELYRLENGIIAIDEGQKLFEARRWSSLPLNFVEKISQHRKHHLDIYTTTQDLSFVDVRVRKNVHELYRCRSILRLPRNERSYPVIQLISVIRKKRIPTIDGDRIAWQTIKTKRYWISKYFTKELYNTYADIGFERYLCSIKYEKKEWRGRIYSRELVNNGKARL